MVKIVAISDVHGKQKDLIIPNCDILISAGDYSMSGMPKEVQAFHQWLEVQPAKHIISVQGNHELWVENNFNLAKQYAEKLCPRVHFIDEGLVEIEGIKIWCSAITPYFYDWAWNRHRGDEIKKHWNLIKDDIDILVTHGPPYGFGDEVLGAGNVGCRDLLDRVYQIKPKVHIFGHIHSGYGEYQSSGIKFINASCCDESYKATNKPIIIEI